MGVTFIYLGTLWIAFLLKRTFPGSQVGKGEVPMSYRLTVVDHFFGVCLWATIVATVALRIFRGNTASVATNINSDLLFRGVCHAIVAVSLSHLFVADGNIFDNT